MDKNKAARLFMLGWRLRVDAQIGAAAWISPEEGEEQIAYVKAESIVAALSDDLDMERKAGGLEYFLRDDDDE